MRTRRPLGMTNFSYLSSGTLRGFAGGRVSAALTMGAAARPNSNAAGATHLVANLVANNDAFIISPLGVWPGLGRVPAYSNRSGVRMISTRGRGLLRVCILRGCE